MSNLKMYMGYSRAGGSEFGAVLIFAHTVREARIVGFTELLTDEYIDFAANLIPHENTWLLENADQDKLKNNIPHVIDNPKTCNDCELWGHSKILDNGSCEECENEILWGLKDE